MKYESIKYGYSLINNKMGNKTNQKPYNKFLINLACLVRTGKYLPSIFFAQTLLLTFPHLQSKIFNIDARVLICRIGMSTPVDCGARTSDKKSSFERTGATQGVWRKEKLLIFRVAYWIYLNSWLAPEHCTTGHDTTSSDYLLPENHGEKWWTWMRNDTQVPRSKILAHIGKMATISLYK